VVRQDKRVRSEDSGDSRDSGVTGAITGGVTGAVTGGVTGAERTVLDPAGMRRSYSAEGLDAADLAAEPYTQFARWFADATRAGLPEPNAMVLSTADAHGRPSSRTVLLKGYDHRGFVFYSNHGSRKGRDLAANPWAALLFPWHAVARQVIVTGPVEHVDRAETETYFHSRPHGSQLGAWASDQSAPIASRADLEHRFTTLAARHPEGTEVPVPDFWGGYRVRATTVEFWQGRPNRLHDRLRYDGDENAASGWTVRRLQP
jgi:pyridoxamine 5'-phosphate oxidase